MADDGNVNTPLQNLTLREAELDGVVLSAEDRKKLPQVKWMAVAKLLTVKDFSAVAMISAMKAAWSRDVTI